MATILLPTLLRPDAAGAASVEVAGSTVGEAFDALFAAHPALRPRVLDRAGRFHRHLLVFHGDRRLPRGDWAAVPLAPGDSLRLLMAVGGGGNDVRRRGLRRRAGLAALARGQGDISGIHLMDKATGEYTQPSPQGGRTALRFSGRRRRRPSPPVRGRPLGCPPPSSAPGRPSPPGRGSRSARRRDGPPPSPPAPCRPADH